MYFNVDPLIAKQSKRALLLDFQSSFNDSLNIVLKDEIQLRLKHLSEFVYKYGVLAEDFNADKQKEIVLKVKDSDLAQSTLFLNLVNTEQLAEIIKNTFKDSIFSPYNSYLTTVIYNNIKPNTRFDEGFNKEVLAQEKNKISPTVGLIKEDAIVIAKGEVVEGEKLQQLKLVKKLENFTPFYPNYNTILIEKLK